MPMGHVYSTGHSWKAPQEEKEFPPYDKRSGEHFWVILVAYKWNPGTEGETILDKDNFMNVNGPGCYYCEMPYSKLLASKRCKGEPK